MNRQEQQARRLFRQAYEAQMAGELEKAIDLYRRSIALVPTAEAHTFLAWTYSFLRRYTEAIDECKKAIEIDPSFGNPYNDIGAYLIDLGRFDEAIPWLRKALKAPRYDCRQYPHFNLSRIHIHRYEFDRALCELMKALELEPDYASARRELTRILARMN
ncbi:MAG: tetratricopeptide repeat protein [Planctomycetes bacterium]|nr:tetratricopeptide repeat protein [Planctomycetota bacterium]